MDPRWVPAIVTKVHGSRSMDVRVCPRGPTWRRHIEQLRPRYGIEEDTEPPEVIKLPGPDKGPEPIRRPKRRNPRMPTGSEYGPGNPRRSARLKETGEGRVFTLCRKISKADREVLYQE